MWLSECQVFQVLIIIHLHLLMFFASMHGWIDHGSASIDYATTHPMHLWICLFLLAAYVSIMGKSNTLEG